MVEGPVGFWSYVHDHNDAVDGAILGLRRLIMGAYSILTGEDLTLFVDTEINWGEEWEKRIADSIAGTTFFIPVITPRFFKSQACRQEVIDFTTKATEASGLNELCLPILFVEVPFLSKDAEDPVVRLVAKTQYVKWHKLRLLDAGSSEHRTAVHELAVEIDRISREVADRPEAGGASTATGGPATSPTEAPDDETPGTLDLIGQAEEVMPQFQSTIEEMGACLSDLGDIAKSNQPNLDRALKQNKMGPRLAVIRKTATELEGPTQKFVGLSTTYASQVIDVNAGIDAIIHLKPYAEMAPDEQAEYRVLADSVRTMRDSASEAFAAAKGLGETFKEIGSLSRDMRKPSQNLQRGIERMGDVQGIYDEWVKGFQEAGVWDEPPDGEGSSKKV
jgi:hypothetical protein